MEARNVFQGMHGAVIRFPPTYKFERHQFGLAGTFFCVGRIVQLTVLVMDLSSGKTLSSVDKRFCIGFH